MTVVSEYICDLSPAGVRGQQSDATRICPGIFFPVACEPSFGKDEYVPRLIVDTATPKPRD